MNHPFQSFLKIPGGRGRYHLLLVAYSQCVLGSITGYLLQEQALPLLRLVDLFIDNVYLGKKFIFFRQAV